MEKQNDYYVKIGVGYNFGKSVGDTSYLLKELKNTITELRGTRQYKAKLRKEFFEYLISLRLNMDTFKTLLPHHEAEVLEKKINDILKLTGKPIRKKKVEKKKKPKKVAKKKPKKKKKIVLKTPEEKVDLLSSEKRELELLRQDLEDISRELQEK